ncbi:protein FAM110C [Macrotis lagotis]|uniref:protein FAM110C n=1 Tax=Macrotis lagotis TaxID=92651 RepID=UPI003D68E0E9
MPTELAPSLGMYALSNLDSSLTTRLLHKGPEYLRKQIEGGDRAKKSAVERLAADKAKYVKSQQVIGAAQAPARLSSTSESSSESCSVESRKSSKDSTGRKDSESGDTWCSTPRAAFSVARRGIGKRQLRPDSLIIYRQKCEFVKGQGTENTRGGVGKKNPPSPRKEKLLVSPDMPRVKEEVRIESEEAQLESKEARLETKETRLHGEETRLERREIRTEIKETRLPSEEARVANKDTAPPSLPTTIPLRGGPPPVENKMPMQAPVATVELRDVKRRGLHRSKSDISSRYSKSFSEFDTFFKYCGLEPEVVEDLGTENFSAGWDHRSLKIRSVSMATSEGGFSHHSGDEGLLEEELTEQVPSSTSVIERNARIIKWLYTCKKAKETESKGAQDLAGKATEIR